MYEDDLYQYYVEMGRLLGKACERTMEVEVIDLFKGCSVTDTVETDTCQGWRIDFSAWDEAYQEVAESGLQNAEYVLQAMEHFRLKMGDGYWFGEEESKRWRAEDDAPLSVCCKAPTFVEGMRRICDKCRCSRPI